VAFAFLLAAGNAGAAEPERKANGDVSGGVWRYAERWVARHDANRDGRLDATEWTPPGEQAGEADANHDALTSAEELAQHLAKFGAHRRIRLMPANADAVPLPSLLRPGGTGAKQPPTAGEPDPAEPPDKIQADERTGVPGGEVGVKDRSGERKYYVAPSRLPAGLPDWFKKCDRDGDGQLTLAEYAELGSTSADKDFARYDRNQDGLVTPLEVLGRAANAKRGARSPAADPETKQEPAVPATGGNEKP
jgi:hypothetical protein